MGIFRVLAFSLAAVLSIGLANVGTAKERGISSGKPGKGAATASVFGDWRADRPGLRHRITIADLPPPYTTQSASNNPREVKRPAGAKLSVPDGFAVEPFR